MTRPTKAIRLVQLSPLVLHGAERRRLRLWRPEKLSSSTSLGPLPRCALKNL
jgi:hypothetical protein